MATVAVLGSGTVGLRVAQLLLEREAHWASVAGEPLHLLGVGVRTPRQLHGIPDSLLTTDLVGLAARADVVVELIGGVEPALTFARDTLGHGATFVTANKAMLARHIDELEALAARTGGRLGYEASAAAALPVISLLRDALGGDQLLSLRGVVNGSTNFVLDQMGLHGASMAEAVAEAGAQGWLEADPSADLDGHDAAHKLVLLARLGWRRPVALDDVQRCGIRELDESDISSARDSGLRMRLVASAVPVDGELELVVEPVLLTLDDPLARAEGSENVVELCLAEAGRLVVHGNGAGSGPTASAVLGDVVRLVAAR